VRAASADAGDAADAVPPGSALAVARH
jgi:hypothetical protein